MIGRYELYVVRDDGRRPWHRRFVIRHLADGRRVAYWWGSYTPDRDAAQDRLLDLSRHRWEEFQALGFDRDELLAMGNAVAGAVWTRDRRLRRRAGPHPGHCSNDGFVGIAFLPDPPDCWLADSVWPGWRHLAHYRYWLQPDPPPDGWCEAEMEETWRWLETATDDDLLAILEDHRAP